MLRDRYLHLQAGVSCWPNHGSSLKLFILGGKCKGGHLTSLTFLYWMSLKKNNNSTMYWFRKSSFVCFFLTWLTSASDLKHSLNRKSGPPSVQVGSTGAVCRGCLRGQAACLSREEKPCLCKSWQNSMCSERTASWARAPFYPVQCRFLKDIHQKRNARQRKDGQESICSRIWGITSILDMVPVQGHWSRPVSLQVTGGGIQGP